ncbi:MAG: hypothetical protein QM767_13135 [Anaeromyxobacter sp.]
MPIRRGLPLLCLLACTAAPEPSAPPPAPAPAPPAEAAPAPTPPPAPAGPVPVLPRVEQATAIEPSGLRSPIKAGEELVVDPGTRFELVLAGGFHDARLSLLDGADAAVEASATRELGSRTTLTLVPTAPLTPAGKYQLRLDGAATRELHDGDGAAYQPASWQVLVAGQPLPPPPKTGKKKRR